MKLFIIIVLISLMAAGSCNDSDSNSKKDATANPAPVKIIPVYLIDSLEHFFGNENWQVITGTDTSYLLFSRQSDYYIKVYRYKMEHGDSVHNIISQISFTGDSVMWSQPGQSLFLKKITGKETGWVKSNSPDTNQIVYKKIDDKKIMLQQDRQIILLNRTITLSDFLVRSRYDFLHGTQLAFKDTSFTVKHPQ